MAEAKQPHLIFRDKRSIIAIIVRRVSMII